MAETDYTKLLSDLGTDANANEFKFDSIIEEALVRLATAVTDSMKSNLTESDAYYSDSDLLQSIIAKPVMEQGTSGISRVDIEANYYADFLNEGVSGTRNKFNSPYSFKKESVSPAFNKSLQKWITKRGIPIESRYSQTPNITKRQRAKLQKAEKKQIAYAMGMVIKQEGIQPTNFINNAISEQSIAIYSQKLSDLLGQNVEIVITNKFK
jgi:hypothetical protein